MLAVGIVVILGLMIIPMPPILLDLFLSFSITLSIVVLLVAAYTEQPLDFSVFPSVLLVAYTFASLFEYRLHAPYSHEGRYRY